MTSFAADPISKQDAMIANRKLNVTGETASVPMKTSDDPEMKANMPPNTSALTNP